VNDNIKPVALRAQAAELRWAAMTATQDLATAYRAAAIRCIELAKAIERLEERVRALETDEPEPGRGGWR
jgi:hypothetical protein